MVRLLTIVVVLGAALLGGCGTSIEDEAAEIFGTCIEEGGGTTGEFEPYVENGQLVLVQGRVDASAELFEECFDFTNGQLGNP